MFILQSRFVDFNIFPHQFHRMHNQRIPLPLRNLRHFRIHGIRMHLRNIYHPVLCKLRCRSLNLRYIQWVCWELLL